MSPSNKEDTNALNDDELPPPSEKRIGGDDHRHYKHPFVGVPLFSMILCNPVAAIIAPIWSGCCAIRWFLARPLNTPVLPKWLPNCFFGHLKRIPHISYGEVSSTACSIVISLLC